MQGMHLSLNVFLKQRDHPFAGGNHPNTRRARTSAFALARAGLAGGWPERCDLAACHD
jgi:hypothetical protein